MLTNDTSPNSRIVFTEYDNVHLANDIQVATFQIIFAFFLVFLRYTWYNRPARTPMRSAADKYKDNAFGKEAKDQDAA